MLSQAEASRAIGTTAYDSQGEKLGKVGQVFLDDSTQQPAFVTVATGLLGRHESLVPLHGAALEGDGLTLAYPRATIDAAPSIDLVDKHLEAADEQRLHEHYQASGARRVSVTRSEERLRAGVVPGVSSRVRLRKYVVVEQETITVPVRKERVVMESVPVADGDETTGEAPELAAFAEGATTAVGSEVVLHEERVVVSTVVVPVERVRLSVETVTVQDVVAAPVRKEQVVVESDDGTLET